MRASLFVLITALLAFGLANAETPPPPNPVKAEMLALSAAMQATLLALANNQLETIPKTIFAVHDEREKTAAALKAGAYHPPKNREDVKGFIATDDAFHDKLVELVKAAKANDLKAATQRYAEVVVECTACHQKYRF